MIVFKAAVEQAKVRGEMKKLGNQMDVFKRSGLDKEYRRLLKQYNSLVARVRELDFEIEEQRRKSALALIVCFVTSDLATLAADQFGEVCDEVNYGLSQNDNEFVKMMKHTAETSAKEWNKIVQIFDKGVQKDNISMFYATFSEHITDNILPMLNDRVKDVMENTEEGKKWL